MSLLEGEALREQVAVLGLRAEWGTVRRHVVIDCSASRAWDRIADVADNASWFTLLQASWCESGDSPGDSPGGGVVRKARTSIGMVMTEDVIVVDAEQRRLQYRLRPIGAFTSHLATIDVIELDPPSEGFGGRCMVVYGTDVAPRPLALVFGNATQQGLDSLKLQLERAAQTD